jgi:hypothetical protein
MSPKGSRDGASSAVMPLCREPWESYYILRRGVLPCCFGGEVIGSMADYAKAWNGPQMQEIRSYLARGELSPYCLRSPGCPIVQRVRAGRTKGETALGPIGTSGPSSGGASGGILRRLLRWIRKRPRRTA